MQTLNAASSGRMMGPLPEITAAVSYKITLIYSLAHHLDWWAPHEYLDILECSSLDNKRWMQDTLILSNCSAQVWPGARLSCLNQSLSGGAGGAWAPTSASRAGSRERATGSIITTVGSRALWRPFKPSVWRRIEKWAHLTLFKWCIDKGSLLSLIENQLISSSWLFGRSYRK